MREVLAEARKILQKLRPEVRRKIRGLGLDDALYFSDIVKGYTDEQLQKISETTVELVISFRKLDGTDQQRAIQYMQDLAAGRDVSKYMEVRQ